MGPINQATEPLGLIAAQPQIYRGTRHPRQRSHLLFQSTFRTPQHDPRPDRHRGWNIRTFHHSLQLSPLVYRQLHRPI